MNDYSNNKYGKQWNLQAINARWEWYIEQVEKILEINIENDKIELIEN